MGVYINYTITTITDNKDINRFNIYCRPINNGSLVDLRRSFSLLKPYEDSENITIYEESNTDDNNHYIVVYKNAEVVKTLEMSDYESKYEGDSLFEISKDIFIKYNEDSRTFDKYILGQIYNDFG